MAQYIGQAPINGYHAKQSLTGDGSTTSFTLDQTVASETAIIVSVGGVLQEPGVAYNLTIGGTKIDFTEAPSSTDTVYIHFLGKAVVQNLQDVNGSEFVLDADGDTSFTADTDDEIDIRVGGSDISTIKSTGYHNLDSIKYVAGTGDDLQLYHDGTNSFLTNSTGALKIATETSGIAITIGHSTSEVTIADNATVAGNLTVTGTLTQTGTQTFDGGLDVDNFSLNGTTLALSSGDMTVDVAGDIILDADGGDIFFKDAGTTFGSATNSSGNLILKSGTTTAATFSGANVTLAGTVDSGAITSTGAISGASLTADDVAIDGKVITMTGSSSDTAVFTAGANGTLSIVTTDAAAAAANIQITADGTAELAGTTVTLDSSGGITLDADGGTITFADGGSSLGTITSSGYSGTAAVATTVTITDNENTDENNAIVFTAGGDVDGGNLGLESDGDLTYNPSSGTLNVPNISVTGTQTIVNSVTMNANNAVIFEGATADAHETTLSTVDATADRTINLPNVSGTLPVLAAASATAITSTPEELNILDGATVVVGEINALDLGSTAVGTAIASKAVILDSNKDYTGIRNFTTTGTVTAGGVLTADAGINVDNITIDGTEIDLSSGDLTIDVAGDIILDADGGDIFFKDGGTTIGEFTNSSSDFVIKSSVSDKDILLKGNDGGSTITALTLDMSAAGAATFNGAITGGGLLTTGGNIVIPDSGNIGSASDTDSMAIASNGVVTFSQIPVLPANSIDSDYYVDGSIDTAHIADDQVTADKLSNSLGDLSGHGISNVGLNSGDKITFTDNTDMRFTVNGNEEMRLEADGDLHVDGDLIAFSTTISDETLKYDINPIDHALDKVAQLTGVTYKYLKDGMESAGLLAQDVEKVMPCAVTERKLPMHKNDGNKYKTLNYDNLHALLIESIKELTAKVEKLENK